VNKAIARRFLHPYRASVTTKPALDELTLASGETSESARDRTPHHRFVASGLRPVARAPRARFAIAATIVDIEKSGMIFFPGNRKQGPSRTANRHGGVAEPAYAMLQMKKAGIERRQITKPRSTKRHRPV